MKLFKVLLVGLIVFMNTMSIHKVSGLELENERYKMTSYYDITRKAYKSNVGRDVYAKDFVSCLYHEDKWLYCVENGVRIEAGSTYGTSDPDKFFDRLINKKTTGLQKRKLLSILMLYAPQRYSGKVTEQSADTYIRYAAAMTLTWEVTDEVRDKDFKYVGADSGKTAPIDGTGFLSSTVKTKFMSYYKEYEKKVLDFLKTPSFSHSEKDKSPTYDLLYDHSSKEFYIELLDTHHVLENYDISKDGYTVTKNGNMLRISTKQKLESSKEIQFEVKDSNKHVSQALIVLEATNKKDQKQISAGQLDKPQIRSYFKLVPKYGSLEIVKTDSQKELVDGALFSLTDKDSFQQDILVEKGKITLDYLKPGTYFLKEKVAPEGYLIDKNEYKIVIKENHKVQHVIENSEPLGKITLKKYIDATETSGLMGDSYLENNTYGLYAKEDIYNRSKTKKYHSKDECISIEKTNKQGEIEWDQLHLGKYYILEEASNESLVVNDQSIDVSIDYVNSTTSHVEVSKETNNKIAKQRIRIFKSSIKDGQPGVVKGLKGAEFTFKLNSDVSHLGYNQAKTYFKGTTDDNGYLTTDYLPYGQYLVKETKTPEGYYGASDFYITVSKDQTLHEIGYEVQNVVVNNIPFESLLKIVKKDKTTGKVVEVPGATFKIKNLDTNQYVSYIDYSAFPQIEISEWVTQSNGTIMLNTKLQQGKYQLEEVKAPEGYLLSKDPVPFEINANDDYEIFEDQKTPLIVVEFLNEAALGRIKIFKEGDVLLDFIDKQFVYEKVRLKDIRFGIYAAEDILDPCGDSTVLYSKGELIEEVISNEEGVALSKKLPLGKYSIKELNTPKGYINDTNEYFVDLKYENQEIEVVEKEISILNLRQTFDLQIHKKDGQSQKGLKGATFLVKAAKDIYNASGKIIVYKGTELEVLVSNEEGIAQSQLDLPVDLSNNTDSLLSVEEVSPPLGYTSQNMICYVDTLYQSDKKEVHLLAEFENTLTQAKIHKVDNQSKEGLSGAHLQIIDVKTQEVLYDFKSEEDGVLIEGLHVGVDYMIQEVKAPLGYIKGEPMTFKIDDIDDVQNIYFENKKKETKIATDDSSGVAYYGCLGALAALSMMILTKKEER